MKAIQTTFVALLLLLTALWGLNHAAALAAATQVFAWRSELIQWSGVLGIGVMSVSMLLAVRPAWVEQQLHGLDKMYRLHKWLGIAGLVLALFHWGWVQVPKWLVQAGWLVRPPRGPRAEQPVELFRFFQSQRGLAEQVGEWAFYTAVLLLVLALVKRFPYRWFFKTHRWLALVYLALVLHSVVLMNYPDWTTPLGAVMLPLMATGTVAAFISLFRRIGAHRKALGRVESVDYLDGVRVSRVQVQLEHRWAGHEAGQFAFVTFDPKEGAHPYTITSAWQGDGRLMFLIKALGDYTRTLAGSLKPGDPVQVEGPYGRFNFEGPSQRQVWIGGGIGITPFVARMKALATRPDGRRIDLFHTTTEVDEQALQAMAADAAAAGVQLHVLVSPRDGRLDGQQLRAVVTDWPQADFWFCGPTAFGHALRHDLQAHGLPPAQFHQELFAMR